MHYVISAARETSPVSDRRRLAAYRELAAALEPFFSSFLAPYCRNCRQVIARLPEAADEGIELLNGVDPGCCHRGAADIFRLEGETGGRSHLASSIIAALQRERRLKVAGVTARGGEYLYRRLRDQACLSGAHCQYFGPRGCLLGELKGPLCLNFICPPIRCDLAAVCGSESDRLLGPEYDFLFIYRVMAVISYDDEARIEAELDDFKKRLLRLTGACRDYLAAGRQSSLMLISSGGRQRSRMTGEI